MIVVKIELWPHGREEDKKNLGTLLIANDGTGTQNRGNYKVWKCRASKLNRPWTRYKSLLQTTYISNFPRRSKTVWHLLHLALTALLNKREV